MISNYFYINFRINFRMICPSASLARTFSGAGGAYDNPGRTRTERKGDPGAMGESVQGEQGEDPGGSAL